jgi:hypothetical protein
VLKVLEENLDFKFDYCLSLAEQVCSEEKDFYVKSLDVLVGEGLRKVSDIIIVDTQMQNFTNRLTNGIYFPMYRLHQDESDHMLKTLLKYLGEFIFPTSPLDDVRIKIKLDFDLLDKFNGFKQTQAFLKIKKTLHDVMETTDEE